MNRWISKVGVFDVEIGDHGVRGLRLAGENQDVAVVDQETAERLDRYIDGDPTSIELDLSTVTSPLQQLTLAKLLEIPRGEVRSYSWVAHGIGNPRAVRAVATAIARNPVPVLIPCHRVVRSDGALGGFLFGPEMKAHFLEYEGFRTVSSG